MAVRDGRLLRFAATLVLAAGSAAAGADQTYTVDSVLDQIDDDLVDISCHTAAGTCTLRAAVMQASVTPGNTTIQLPAGTYVLTRLPAGANGPDSGDLNLVKSAAFETISIQGAGAQSTIIDGNDLDRVFRVTNPTVAVLSNVTIRNGTALDGGGILVEGQLDLHGARVVDNVATQNGGGIFLLSADSSVIEFSEIAGNQAAGHGGGIYVASGSAGALYFDNGSIRANVAGGFGGGVYFFGTWLLSLTNTTVSGNSARLGGGIVLATASATGELIRSSVFENQATDSSVGRGGGIFNASTLYATNSTISGNHAADDGGGILNTGTTWLYNATIAFNDADSDADPNGGTGGGFYNEVGGGFALRNSVVAGNTRSGAPIADDCVGAADGYGHNRFGSFAGCALNHTGSCGGSDLLLPAIAELGPLQFNGGPTPTHAIQAGSALIDDVDSPCVCQDRFGDPLSFDQREGARVVGARCDVGAFEFGALPAGALFADGFESGNTWKWR